MLMTQPADNISIGKLRVEELARLLVDLHVLAVGDGRRLGRAPRWRQRHGRRVAWNSSKVQRRLLRCYGQDFDVVADEFAMCFRMISNTAAAREARGVGPCEPACRRIDDSSELLFHESTGARVQDVGSTDVRGQRRVVESVV